MLAIGRLKVAAAALAGSWLLVIVATCSWSSWPRPAWWSPPWRWGTPSARAWWPSRWCVVTRRICGRAAVEGTGHAMLAGLAAGVAGAAVGVAVSLAGSGGGKLLAAGVAVAAAACATAAFGVVAFLLDRGDLRAVAGGCGGYGGALGLA